MNKTVLLLAVFALLGGIMGGIGFSVLFPHPKITYSAKGWEITGIVAPVCPDSSIRKVYPDKDESSTLAIDCEVPNIR